MATNDGSAPATQGDIQYLAKLVTDNTQRITNFEDKVDKGFERSAASLIRQRLKNCLCSPE